MLAAIDVGHSEVKAIINNQRIRFPAVLGDVQTLHADTPGYIDLETESSRWFVGQAALEQSLTKITGQDPTWAYSPEYRALLFAAISEATSPQTDRVIVDLVAGLPYADFANREEIAGPLLDKAHIIKRPGHRPLSIEIRNAFFAPQGLAALSILAEPGQRSALLDLGGRTLNWATFQGGRAVGGTQRNYSNEVGALFAVQNLIKQIQAEYGRIYQPHELIQVLQNGRIITAYGQRYDIDALVKKTTGYYSGMVESVISAAWGDLADIDRLYLVGGGALLIGDSITARFPQAVIVDAPTWANARAYEVLGKLKFRSK